MKRRQFLMISVFGLAAVVSTSLTYNTFIKDTTFMSWTSSPTTEPVSGELLASPIQADSPIASSPEIISEAPEKYALPVENDANNTPQDETTAVSEYIEPQKEQAQQTSGTLTAEVEAPTDINFASLFTTIYFNGEQVESLDDIKDYDNTTLAMTIEDGILYITTSTQ